ncbi:unnamed protein product, partial [Ectocarpus sp. 12 AP-2014]
KKTASTPTHTPTRASGARRAILYSRRRQILLCAAAAISGEAQRRRRPTVAPAGSRRFIPAPAVACPQSRATTLQLRPLQAEARGPLYQIMEGAEISAASTSSLAAA